MHGSRKRRALIGVLSRQCKLDYLLDVLVLLLGGDAVLVDDEVGSLLDSGADDVVDLLVLEGLVDVGLAAVVAVVGSGGVRGVDGE